MKNKTAITLLSGGLDSMVSTAIAAKRHKIVLALTFDYGQRAAKREIEAARKIAKYFNIPHKVVPLKWLSEICKTSLVARNKKVPLLSLGALSKKGVTASSAKAVWVPNRNALFVNIAAAFAETIGSKVIVAGFNKEEAATFPDNSPEFVSAANRTLALSTMIRPKVFSFTQRMTKRDMVDFAFESDLPIELVWSCYLGGKLQCGRCESCMRFIAALS